MKFQFTLLFYCLTLEMLPSSPRTWHKKKWRGASYTLFVYGLNLNNRDTYGQSFSAPGTRLEMRKCSRNELKVKVQTQAETKPSIRLIPAQISLLVRESR